MAGYGLRRHERGSGSMRSYRCMMRMKTFGRESSTGARCTVPSSRPMLIRQIGVGGTRLKEQTESG
eukprot:3625371-Prymnesium_polylepis.1